MAYRSFVPNPLPPAPPVELTEDIVALLVKANSQLAVLESAAARIPNAAGNIGRCARPDAGCKYKPERCRCRKLHQGH